MRLDFNVLWVDDQPDQLRGEREAISRGMADQGFDFLPRICTSIDDVRKLVAEDLFRDQVDLILVDWDLGAQLKGQEVIAEIRNDIQYKDVIFYSSRTTVPELREHAFKAGAEGVYCASKGDIVTETLGVFETLVKKVLDLDHSRGIVMGATSDIDAMVVQCLRQLDAKGSAEEKQQLLDKAKALISATIKSTQKKIEKLEAAAELGTLIEEHFVFTANDRLRVMNTVLAAARFDDHADLRSGIGTYIKKVVPMRNDLGHIVLVPEGATEMVSIEGKKVSLEEMRELRRFLIEVRLHLRKFLDDLVA